MSREKEQDHISAQPRRARVKVRAKGAGRYQEGPGGPFSKGSTLRSTLWLRRLEGSGTWPS